MHWPTKEKARQHFSLDKTDGTAPRTEKGIRGRLDRAMPYREHGEGGGGFRETCWPLWNEILCICFHKCRATV
jgi:hypothetical protein